MALSYGFFNSISNDRLYDATHFSKYLEGIIQNGCFPNATGFKASANGSAINQDPPSVIIAPGKAYYDGMWFINDSNLTYYMFNGSTGSITGGAQQTVAGRYHHLYFCYDTNETTDGRKVTINCLTDSSPNTTPPANSAGKYYMPLATIADQVSAQPQEVHITDQRLHAGVASTTINTEAIADSAVTTDKIADSNVTVGKLAAIPQVVNSQILSAVTSVTANAVKDIFTFTVTPTNDATYLFFIDMIASRTTEAHTNMVVMLRNSASANSSSGTIRKSGAITGLSAGFVNECSLFHAVNVTAGTTYNFKVSGNTDRYTIDMRGGAASEDSVCSLLVLSIPR